MRDKKEERGKREGGKSRVGSLLPFALYWGLFCEMQMQPDGGGLMQLGDVTTMSNAARRWCGAVLVLCCAVLC
jgi:hypothetical protein